MSNSESKSTQVIFEETQRLFEIDTTEEQEEEKEEGLQVSLLATHIIINVKLIVRLECILSIILKV